MRLLHARTQALRVRPEDSRQVAVRGANVDPGWLTQAFSHVVREGAADSRFAAWEQAAQKHRLHIHLTEHPRNSILARVLGSKQVTVPKISEMYVPTLRLAGGKVLAGAKEVVEAIAVEFNLAEEDLAEPNGNGTQTHIVNNASFSLVHLQAAKMLKKIGKNKDYLITEHGKKYLQSGLRPTRWKDIVRF